MEIKAWHKRHDIKDMILKPNCNMYARLG